MAVASLLITIVTQMISTILGMRGRNLAAALEVMMVTLDPGIKVQFAGAAKRLANAVLTNPAISDSALSAGWKWFLWLRRATAIRSDELISVLEQIAGTSIAAAADNSAVIKDLVDAAKVSKEKLKDVLTEKVSNATTAAGDATTALRNAVLAHETASTRQTKAAALVGSANAGAVAKRARIWMDGLKGIERRLAEEKGQALSKEFNLFLGDRLAASHLLAALRDNYAVFPKGTTGSSDLEKWFNSVQDRAQQWYGTKMRTVTSGCALLAAFSLQLDTFQLLQRISSDADVRSRLVAEADTLQREDSAMASNPSAQDAVLYQDSLIKLGKLHPEIGDKLKSPPSGASLSDINGWIRTGLQGSAKTEKIVEDFDGLYASAKLTLSSQVLKRLNSDFNESGLLLLPKPYPTSLAQLCCPMRHLGGLLVSAALLSLGAPFWFNILKTITNLRPILANEVDKNPKQDSP